MRTANLASAPTVEPRDGARITKLVEGEEMNLLHVRMEPGATHPGHSHPNEQIGYVLRGELVISLEDGEQRTIGADESFQIDGGVAHSVENHGDVAVESLELFAPPRSLDYWDE